MNNFTMIVIAVAAVGLPCFVAWDQNRIASNATRDLALTQFLVTYWEEAAEYRGFAERCTDDEGSRVIFDRLVAVGDCPGGIWNPKHLLLPGGVTH